MLLPSSDLYSVVTTGSTNTSLLNSFGSTDNTSTYESIVGIGLIGVGLVLEVFSLFTDVGAVPGLSAAHSELEALNPSAPPPAAAKPEEKKP